MLEFNVGVLTQSEVSGYFSAELLCSLRHNDGPQEWRNSCLWLQPRAVLGSFFVVLMNFHLSQYDKLAEFKVSIMILRLLEEHLKPKGSTAVVRIRTRLGKILVANNQNTTRSGL